MLARHASADRAAPSDGAPNHRRRAGWAWLAGADGLVLRRVPSEAGFLDALGMWVAGMAIVSGFAMTVAASQWWDTSIVSVLWVLPLWAVLYRLIERLVLKSFGTSWVWNVVLAVPRLLLSLAIALLVGSPMSTGDLQRLDQRTAEQGHHRRASSRRRRRLRRPTRRRSPERRRRSPQRRARRLPCRIG